MLIAVLVDKARAEQVPVVWVAHSDEGGMPRGSSAWQYVDELRRDGSEPLVHKTFADSFEDTDLGAVLAGLEVGQLVVTGAQTTSASGPPCTGRSRGATTRP